jgi:hypothetical protein
MVRSQGVAPKGLQLGFAALDLKEIRRGVRELAIALEGERKAFDPGSQKSRWWVICPKTGFREGGRLTGERRDKPACCRG